MSRVPEPEGIGDVGTTRRSLRHRDAEGRGVTELSSRLGIAGATLGVIAGVIQWSFGAEIPELTGSKLHPVQLGIITILLSLVAMAASLAAKDLAARSTRGTVLVALGLLIPAGICFTTVGSLWYLPGPLLIAAAFLVIARFQGWSLGFTPRRSGQSR